MDRNIATPAEGPSFGVAPAGTCTWMSDFSSSSGAMPSDSARDFTTENAACALSFITSPSWPVRMSLPLPGMRAASMKRMSPPNGVQARPVATPGDGARSAISASKRFGPRIETTSSAPITLFSMRPSATRAAVWRMRLPISRSRLRTPASRV